MITEVKTIALKGLEVEEVLVQVDIQNASHHFSIVGLPDKAVAESKERIKTVLNNLGLAIALTKIVVNLSPADVIKEGSHYDLPIIMAILAGIESVDIETLENYIIMGEIGLDGKILPVGGVLPAAIYSNQKSMGLICPQENGSEAAWSGNNSIIAAGNIVSLINHLKGYQQINRPEAPLAVEEKFEIDFSDVVGQDYAKRAFEIAAAGGHHLLMIGPPGAGKSMLAARLPTILPPMNSTEILETSMILSISGSLKNGKLKQNRPFRDPHHTSTVPAMTGGGHSRKIGPGEISLAHNGVLFLDELPEFSPQVIETLRQPLERKYVNISRSNTHVTYPCDFQLIAAMNPCKCGYFSDPTRACRKVPFCAQDYMGKISGPIYDRIDMVVELKELTPVEISQFSKAKRESSSDILKRVLNARKIQTERYAEAGINLNSKLSGKQINKFAILDDEANQILLSICQKLKLSMRSHDKLIRIARTIADLASSEKINKSHMLEAVNFRGNLVGKPS